jgi:predicted ester cyclase
VGDHAARLWAGLPDLRLEPAGDPLGDGTRAAAPLRLAGTHDGPLGELPPTGRRLAVDCVAWLEAETDRVTSARTIFDLYDAATQLGVLPAPGSMGEKALLVLRGFGLRA